MFSWFSNVKYQLFFLPIDLYSTASSSLVQVDEYHQVKNILFHASNGVLFRCMDMISVGDNQATVGSIDLTGKRKFIDIGGRPTPKCCRRSWHLFLLDYE
jgi:hypothetical protein